MDLSTTRELYYLVGSVCLLLITIFLCWALFEVARLFRRANHLVDEADTKLHEIEASARGLLERITSFTSYASILGEGIKSIMGYLSAKTETALEDMEDDEEEGKKKKRK
jgi:hypothetical protein